MGCANGKQDEPKDELAMASATGDLAAVRKCLSEGAPEQASRGSMPVHKAAAGGHADVVTALVQAGHNKDAKDTKNSYTALHVASQGGHEEVVRVLVQAGADTEAKDKSGLTSLYLAVHHGHAQPASVLLQAGANPKCESKSGLTALHMAVVAGDAELATALVQAGADKNASYDGDTPLHLAFDMEHTEIAEMLVQAGADIAAKDKDGDPLLHTFGENPAHAMMLIRAGADLEAKDSKGQTVLHRKVQMLYMQQAHAKGENEQANKKLFKRVKREVQQELKKYLSMVAKDHQKREIISTHFTQLKTRLEQEFLRLPIADAVSKLVQAGANVDVADEYDFTILMTAVSMGSTDLVKTLVQAGANVQTTNKQDDHTALMYASSQGHVDIVTVLVQAGANVEAKDKKYGSTALSHAVSSGHVDIVTILVRAGANTETKNVVGKTALHLAAAEGKVDIVAVLLRARANLEAKDDKSATPLHWAVHNNQAEVVRVLLQAGADTMAISALGTAEEAATLPVIQKLLTEPPQTKPIDYFPDPAASRAVAPGPTGMWHFFLSHTQRNGDAKTLAADMYHEFKNLGYECWLDVKMPKQDGDAMQEGVENSDCVLAIITGGEETGFRYFERGMCVQELRWAINAGKGIVPVVTAADKPNVGEYIAEGKSKGIDLSGCDFKHVDRSNTTMLQASLQTILNAMKSPPKARFCETDLLQQVATENADGIIGLEDLFVSLGLGDKVSAAAEWCGKMGADSLDDLKDEDYAGQLAKELVLPPIKERKLVKALLGTA